MTPAPAKKRWSIWRIIRWSLLAALGLAIVMLVISILFPPQLPRSEPLALTVAAGEVQHLRPVSDFAAIADPGERSVALFVEAGRVIQHPRCMNCHPRTDTPTQTDTLQPHLPTVTRGPDGGGEPTLRCSTCHQAENFEASGVPGNPKWKLAPAEMAWQGKTLGEICRQIQDPRRGGMPPDELHHHMAEDELVGWAWHPGGKRQPAPGTQAEFGDLILAWLSTGAKCPA